jgi:hypothetical protein
LLLISMGFIAELIAYYEENKKWLSDWLSRT